MTAASRRIGLICAALALALAACGGGASGEPAVGASPSPNEVDGSGFPVTITQAEGEVTIEEAPQRVVALDFPSADAALALGVAPVGMAELSYLDGGVQRWTRDALDGAEPALFATDDGFPFEVIARLEPDVILATNTYPLIGESWEELNRIAPVVGHVEAPGIDSWQQGVEQIGRALGRSGQATELVAEVEGAIAEARRAHPAFAGRTVSFFNYASGGLYVIDSDDDLSIKFLRQLGFAGVTDTVAGLPGSDGGRAQVSPERYDLIEADLVLGTSSDDRVVLDRLAAEPTFAQVPAVRRGAFVPLDIGPATALAFPSVLSLPYALEVLVPTLADALEAP